MIGHNRTFNVGFGNISQRINENSFLISGTQTGHIEQLDKSKYAIVTDYRIEENKLFCKGEINASSEGLSHAVLYEQNPAIQVIIHIHHKELWQKLLYKAPTTPSDVPYGTPEMALSIQDCYLNNHLEEQGILVMAGHEDGIISFGTNFEQAWKLIKNQL